MSHVLLLAADKPLPLCDRREFREHNVPGFTIGMTCGFQVSAHKYYRYAVEQLDLDMKPFQYELSLETCQTDLEHLLTYLRENFAPSEEVQLWSLWVGLGGGESPRHYRGSLEEFDPETLEMLTTLQREPDHTGEYGDGLISQVCVTVEI